MCDSFDFYADTTRKIFQKVAQAPSQFLMASGSSREYLAAEKKVKKEKINEEIKVGRRNCSNAFVLYYCEVHILFVFCTLFKRIFGTGC